MRKKSTFVARFHCFFKKEFHLGFTKCLSLKLPTLSGMINKDLNINFHILMSLLSNCMMGEPFPRMRQGKEFLQH